MRIKDGSCRFGKGIKLRKIFSLIALFFAIFNWQGSVASVFPHIDSSGSKTILLIDNRTRVKEVFTLIHPSRLVVDQKLTDKQQQQLDTWRKRHTHIAGVKEIRIGSKPHHVTRLVIELLPGWKSNLTKNKKYFKFSSYKLNSTHIISKKKIQTAIAKAKACKKQITIVIDPGHGGKDPGASGRFGHKEKYVVLKIAQKLAKSLNKSTRYHVILTRNSDRFLPLRKRLDIARKHSADLFISIHADAFQNNSARGSSVYALSQRGATSEAARWLANSENNSEMMGGVELDNKSRLLQSVLINLSQTASVRDSLKVGSLILNELGKTNKLHYRKVEQAAFVVLKSPDIPSLLIETGFISNRKEERLLLSSEHQQKIANAISRGIDKYFKVKYTKK